MGIKVIWIVEPPTQPPAPNILVLCGTSDANKVVLERNAHNNAHNREEDPRAKRKAGRDFYPVRHCDESHGKSLNIWSYL